MDKNLSAMKEILNNEEIGIIADALLNKINRYNKAEALVSDRKACMAIAEAKGKLYEVFQKVNSMQED